MSHKTIALICVVMMIAGCSAALAGAAGDRSCDAPALRFVEGSGTTAPEVVHKVNPVYPEEARKEKLSGVVVLDSIIDATGAVIGVEVVESADARLAAAAEDALRQWRFSPARNAADEPISVCYMITIKFALK